MEKENIIEEVYLDYFDLVQKQNFMKIPTIEYFMEKAIKNGKSNQKSNSRERQRDWKVKIGSKQMLWKKGLS